MGLCFGCFHPLKNRQPNQEENEEYSNLNDIEEEIPQQEIETIKKFNSNVKEIEPWRYQEYWKMFNKFTSKKFPLIKKMSKEDMENRFKEFNIFILAVGENKNNYKYYIYSELEYLYLGECNVDNEKEEIQLKLKSKDEHLETFLNVFEAMMDDVLKEFK
jgi:hypothetical protein